MKKYFFLKVLVLTLTFCTHTSIKANAQNSIEGVWSWSQYASMERAYEWDFSWGRRAVSRYFDIIVDLHSTPPDIRINNFTWDRIVSVNEKNNVTELTFYFARGDFSVTMIFHFNEDGTMWIEPLEGGLYYSRTGEDNIFYKIDGP
jgi:hypothetical protein